MDREICLLRSSRSYQVDDHISHHKNGALTSGIDGFMEEISLGSLHRAKGWLSANQEAGPQQTANLDLGLPGFRL